MKDPNYIQAWADSLTVRMRIERTAPLADAEPTQPTRSSPLQTKSTVTATVPITFDEMTPNCRVTRSSPTSFAAFSDLPPAANILLFTPVLKPASSKGKLAQSKLSLDPFEPFSPSRVPMDPFEPFGRALSKYHKRIRHVPYVPKVGFTATHAAFLSQADAVITVVCEPERAIGKNESVGNQMDFAETALDAMEGKEANAANTLLLVQCGGAEFRLPADAMFVNVIECGVYDADVAKQLAQTVFRS